MLLLALTVCKDKQKKWMCAEPRSLLCCTLGAAEMFAGPETRYRTERSYWIFNIRYSLVVCMFCITTCAKYFHLKITFKKVVSVCTESFCLETCWLGLQNKGHCCSWKVVPEAASVVVALCGCSPCRWFSDGPAGRMLNVHHMLDHLLSGGSVLLILDDPALKEHYCCNRGK